MQKFKSSSSSSPASSASAGQSASKSSGNGTVYQDFWQAPPRLWKRELQDWEIELVQVRLLLRCRVVMVH